MISDDERREVAARLRNYESLRESFRESPICAFLDALGGEYLDWKGVCNRLADLIEPERTCEIVGFTSAVRDSRGLIEYPPVWNLSCGHEAAWRKPLSCPNCSAKVVE